MLSTVSAKGLVLGVLFVMTFGLGMIPVKLMTVIQKKATSPHNRYPSSPRQPLSAYKRVLSFLSCYAAGVFLATCFLDLLPAVRKHLITVLFAMNIITGFPLAEFIMCVGLFLILIAEQIVLSVKERPVVVKRGVHEPLLSKTQDEERSRPTQVRDMDKASVVQNNNSILGISNETQDISVAHKEYHDEETNILPDKKLNKNAVDDEHHHHSDINFQNHSPLRALLMLMALSLHSVFEGLAVGLQPETADVLGIFAALVLHKSILSFSLGMNLIQSRLSTKICIRSILFFSVTAPIGVAVGLLITDLWNSVTSNLVDGILQGLASGTFLYVTFFEVIPSEFNSSHDRLLKLVFLLLGYSTVSGIMFLSDDVKKPFCRIDDVIGKG